MNEKKISIYFFIFALLSLFSTGCTSDNKNLPVVTTVATVSDITENSATSGGTVSNDNGTVLAKGVCWSTSINPTIKDSLTKNGQGSGSFVSRLTNLNGNTKYYVRAYATTSSSTVYGNQINFTTSSNASFFAKGADVSWVTQMEATGKKFYNSTGTEMECMTLLKSLGMNSIRLRVWVNPVDGWCNSQDMLVKAIRANNLGMKIMIDFHNSDSWADPSKQTKPAVWTNLNFTDLKTALTNHTTDVLNLLKKNNITPEWVQVGNETGNGMLWEDGKASTNMTNYAALNNAGYNAVKAVFPNTKVVVHIQDGFNNTLFRWLFDGLKNNGGKWDVIGLSLYPSTTNWSTLDTQCLTNMNDMVSRYGKEVILCEVGMSWDSPNICKSFLTDLIQKTKSVTGNKGLGVFYWEPESYAQWSGYTLGAFDNKGKPTIALDAFK
jgi:arabinogalactan endo-1,4-beta-galactosidase